MLTARRVNPDSALTSSSENIEVGPIELDFPTVAAEPCPELQNKLASALETSSITAVMRSRCDLLVRVTQSCRAFGLWYEGRTERSRSFFPLQEGTSIFMPLSDNIEVASRLLTVFVEPQGSLLVFSSPLLEPCGKHLFTAHSALEPFLCLSGRAAGRGKRTEDQTRLSQPGGTQRPWSHCNSRSRDCPHRREKRGLRLSILCTVERY